MNCYCALHGWSLGKKGEVDRLSENKVLIHLPNGLPESLAIDKEEKRTLIVFDGFLVAGGLSKKSQIVSSRVVETFTVKIEDVRKFYKYSLRPGYVNYGKTIEVSLERYFILLPYSCTAIAFRFRLKSLSPQGMIIKVENNGVARFKTINN
jgi:hypothetical protein